ncbi:ABC transporter, partial [Lineolata rhizophorae]
GCVQVISIAPTIVAVLALLIDCSRPLLKWRPQWLRNFASEAEGPPDELFGLINRKRWTQYTAALILLSATGLTLSLVSAFKPWSLVGLILTSPWFIVTLLLIKDRPVSTPGLLLPVYIVTLLVELIGLCNPPQPDRNADALGITKACVSFCTIIVILLMPLRDPNMQNDHIARPSMPPTDHLGSPEDNLSLWQFMTVSWMTPLIALGKSRKLNDEDVWLLPYEFWHRRLHERFREIRGTVIRRLLAANGIDLIITAILGIVESLANFSAPVLLQQLLRAIEDDKASKRVAIIYAAIILAVRLVACQSAVFSLWYCRRCYERSRGEMITMIYEKTLSRKFVGYEASKEQTPQTNGVENGSTFHPHLKRGRLERVRRSMSQVFRWWKRPTMKDNSAAGATDTKKSASMGKILNLMRNDVYEVAQRFWEFPNLITKPLAFVLSIALIWKLLGWPCLIGMLTVIIAQLINVALVRALLRWERLRRAVTDAKLQITSQFVEAIRHLRWYDWQYEWLVKILDSRHEELRLRLMTNLWHTAISTTNLFASAMFPVVAFYAYTAIGGYPLRVDIAFPALQLFSMLDVSLRELPNLITVLLNAAIAVGRIENFMEEPDKEELFLGAGSTETTLALKEASFYWPGFPNPVLEDVSVSFPVGLTVICGKVGEGKSSLLQAILGELDKPCGKVIHPDEMIGYCAQTPWLQSMSIRENILFNAPFEERRYKQVLEACALTPDLANFKHGDLSNIGENGIGLSGGQKSRVALARAIYSRARILLLDDPFAALDHSTAETIIRRLFQGPLMQDRTICLVTHRTELCFGIADQVIEVTERTTHVLDVSKLKSDKSALERVTSEPQDEMDAKALEEQNDAAVPEKFIEEEHRATGGVMASVYWQYIKAGKLTWWIILIAIFAIFRLNRIANYWFLKKWGEAYENPHQKSVSDVLDRLPSPETNVKPWLLGFFLIALIQSILYFFSELTLMIIIYTAGKRLFAEVMHRVSCATFRFYDVTPVGRLMNRLTSDIGTLDGNISAQLQNCAWYFIAWVSSIVVIASVTPLFLIFSIALTAWFIFIFFRFLPTSQSLRRLEMVSLTPLMSNFGALVEGLTTVRAFRAQPHFQDRVIRVTDAFQKMDHFYWSLQAWLMYRFDALSAFSTFALTLLALYDGLSPGLTAFVLTTAANFVSATHTLCKRYGQLQMDFVSVERVIELLHLEEEPAGSVDPPASWPAFGDDIVFENVTIRYAPHLDPSLSNLSFNIPGGSTVAVTGRTGSGKSTLALTLLATILPQPGGHIWIGNIDITQVNVHALRRRVTFVAQDPVLFPGTIRQNLDPINEHSDQECGDVLRRMLGPEWSLTSHIDGGGRNLSQGQRQLVGLGRAVLRRSPIVILDEATASIDRKTAMYIQQVLRDELKESTVITIAHRVEAVKDADYCIILENGRVKECGPARTGAERQSSGVSSSQASDA